MFDIIFLLILFTSPALILRGGELIISLNKKRMVIHTKEKSFLLFMDIRI
jgi:hypothetical protein